MGRLPGGKLAGGRLPGGGLPGAAGGDTEVGMVYLVELVEEGKQCLEQLEEMAGHLVEEEEGRQKQGY